MLFIGPLERIRSAALADSYGARLGFLACWVLVPTRARGRTRRAIAFNNSGGALNSRVMTRRRPTRAVVFDTGQSCLRLTKRGRPDPQTSRSSSGSAARKRSGLWRKRTPQTHRHTHTESSGRTQKPGALRIPMGGEAQTRSGRSRGGVSRRGIPQGVREGIGPPQRTPAVSSRQDTPRTSPGASVSANIAGQIRRGREAAVSPLSQRHDAY
jgi:hypothetical protein